MSWKENLYLRLPLFIQTALIKYQGAKILKLRYNSDFYKWLNIYKNHDTWTEEELVAFQNDELQFALKNALKSSYWNKMFETYGVDVENSNAINELKKLPIISKVEARKYNKEILIKPYNEALCAVTTSGTTGGGLSCPENQMSLNKQWAIWWRYRNRLGIEMSTWCAWFGGKIIVPATVNKPPFWRINEPGKQILFSPHHLSEDTAKLYHEQMMKHKIEWLHGYPSQLTYLVSIFKKIGLSKIATVRVITTGAENLLDSQRKAIEAFFGVPVYQHYGLAERVANISEMPNGELIEDKSYSFVEYVPLENEENLFKIIGTNFSNTAFPLFRYDTGDLAYRVKKDGKWVILDIVGRSEDYITLPSGGRLGPFSLIMKPINNVSEAQLTCKVDQTFLFKVVKESSFSKKDEEQLHREIKRRSTSSFSYSIEYVDKIPRTKSGKLKAVIIEQA